MAEESIASNSAGDEREVPIDIGAYLTGHTGCDTIHNGACALEFINEVLSEYHGHSTTLDRCEVDNVVHGRWLVLSTIVQTLRHGKQQLHVEHARHREMKERLRREVNHD